MQNHQSVESYEILCCVGDGSQGQAFLAQKEGQNYVIKLYFPSQHAQRYFSKQVQILSQITSPFIVRMIEHYEAARAHILPAQEIRPAIVLQFAEHGQLFKIVYHCGHLDQDVSRTLFYQIITALKSLKDVNITHRDIKLENILLDEKFNIKLADFGYARNSQGDNHDFYLSSWKGSEQYMAPEIHNRHYKGQKVDLFAAGVALFLMFCRYPPFKEAKQSNFYYRLIIQGKIQQFWQKIEEKSKRNFPADLKNLLNKLFSPNPSLRPSVEQILEDKWTKGKILTSEELYAYMQPIYQKLMQKDKQTNTMRKKLKERIEGLIAQQNRLNQQRERSREDNEHNRQEGGIRSEHAEDAIKDILEFNISQEMLPQIKHMSLHYAKITPVMALLWLNQFLSDLIANKSRLCKHTLESIQLTEYHINYDRKGKITLTLSLEINSETDSVISETVLVGQIASWNNLISIQWKDQNGTAYSSYEIIQTLSNQFQLTFN